MPTKTPETISEKTWSPPQVHRINECCQILGIGRSTYYVMLSEGLIDPPLKISKRARGYTDEYLQSLIKKMGVVS